MIVTSPEPVRERDFQDAVIQLAKLNNWMVHHQRPARTKDGSWRTAVQGDAGWPDLILVRDGRMIIAELKSEKGKLTPGQEDWLRAIDDVKLASGGAVQWAIWRPSHWPEIERWLKGEEDKIQRR